MSETDWLQMLEHRQHIHHFARKLLPRRGGELSASELEVLSLLYLHPEENTPLSLSRQSGMKKEAVSRSIRQLFLLGCLEKEPNPRDERSYGLRLTETGLCRLRENYGEILRPLYALRRRMGTEFDDLCILLEKADRLLEETENQKENQKS